MGQRSAGFPPFKLRGEVGIPSVPDYRVQLLAYAAMTEGDIVCDCTDLEFLDSSGVSMFVEFSRELAERGRKLRLTHITGRPRRVLELAGLVEYFE